MTNRSSRHPMRPSIRLKPGAELRAILDRWAREAHAARPQPALRLIKGGRP